MKVFWNVVWAFALAASAAAQGLQTGTLRGVVHDPQGLAVASATVTIVSPAMQAPRSTATDDRGRYAFPGLPPGDYQVTIARQAFDVWTSKVAVPLGLDVAEDATLRIAGAAESVNVVADAPRAVEAASVGLNITHDQVERLALSRTVAGIAELSPGLTAITPNKDQVSISGAFAFDNNFMLNGVDIGDNLLGAPQTLFVEDAIQEVQTLTSGVPAEFGRFSGGVVNAITRSGGNIFSGSARLNLTNPSWSATTPFEDSRHITHDGALNKAYEATFGGPLLQNRLWFFSSGRWEDTNIAQALPQTGIANTEVDKNRRGEVKLTGTLVPGHTLQGGYLNNNTEFSSRPSIPSLSIDPSTIAPASVPNWFAFANYHGVLDGSTLAEVQYSQRKWTRMAGGTNTNVLESPFLALSVGAQYNAPYFDASDPEGRNNVQLTGNVTRFMNRGGRHELKAGYEWFRSQRTGGNNQSATNEVFHADYVTGAGGVPVLDANGRIVPVFAPGKTLVENFLPQRDSVLDIDTNSLFAQDHWTITGRWSADLGVRFEKVKSRATGDIIAVDTHTLVPRLGTSYDLTGSGRFIAHATYGHYAGRYDENQFGLNSNVGNADETIGVYLGPAGQGRSFAPGFDLANYLTVAGAFPTANVRVAPDLSSPVTREFTLSLDTLAGRRGVLSASYVFRRTSNLVEDFVLASNGTTKVIRNGVDFGTFSNFVLGNTDAAFRHYQAAVFEGRYTVLPGLAVNGHYTLMLQDDGNYQGESANNPGQLSMIGNYPEAFDPARNFPSGRLQNFQRHKLRLWTDYTVDARRYGAMTVSGIWRVNSGQVYSLAALNQPLTATQTALLNAAGYPDAPTAQTIFFGPLGSQTFPGYGVLDASFNYAVPVFRSAHPWVKLDVFNLLNNDKLIGSSTTIKPDPNSPKDSLGLPTGYIQSASFGTATSNSQFPAPFPGATGGRTFRMAVGVRF